jgi:hypothetical protein
LQEDGEAVLEALHRPFHFQSQQVWQLFQHGHLTRWENFNSYRNNNIKKT